MTDPKNRFVSDGDEFVSDQDPRAAAVAARIHQREAERVRCIAQYRGLAKEATTIEIVIVDKSGGEWDESKHPRNHGEFAASGGASSDAHVPFSRQTELGPAQTSASLTKQLRDMKKLPAKNDGTLSRAIISAGHYAKKMGKPMYVYGGNSYMHSIFRVTEHLSDVHSFQNTGDRVVSVKPDLEVAFHNAKLKASGI